MKHLKINILSFGVIILLFLAGTDNILAQSEKKVLSIEDVELWRNNAVTLSDDGKWHTILYSLREKPDSKSDSTKTNSEKKDIDLYGEDSRTNVLYICHAGTGVKYQIKDGSNPVFSAASDWIAYRIKPESDQTKGEENGKEKETVIELKNLITGKTKQYISSANYQFAEDKNYFITSDKNSLLIYDLDKLSEHYIGNIGEFLIDKKSKYIAYTISSEDKRGNGIYLYNPEKRTTRALKTGNYIYSSLSWNNDKTALAAFKYNKNKEKVNFENMSISIISEIDSKQPEALEYKVKDMNGMPEGMAPATIASKIIWSNDEKRLFIKIMEYDTQKEKKPKKDKTKEEESTVNVWHWKDKKLLSQRMLEENRKRDEVYEAIFFLKSNNIFRLTSKKIQRLTRSPGTDNWAVGTDNRNYISDWDVRKNDLYRINMLTGDKNLIEEKYSGGVQISPNGEKIILWKDGHYWFYSFKDDEMFNITSDMDVSFINVENDHWGSKRDYGFVGWVKGKDAVIVNHKLDLWLLSLEGSSKSKNLTESNTSKESTRFRFDDQSFSREQEIEDRYIDLSSPIILSAFNILTKYAGYYQLDNNKLKKLIYQDASFSGSRGRSGIKKAEKSDVIIYSMGDYRNFPEAYLSDMGFSGSNKITNTNPQQEDYKWGHRVLIDYTNDDGVALQGVLSIPDDYTNGQKLPMIVYSYEKLSQSMYSYPAPNLSGSQVCEMMYVSDGYLFLRPDIHFNVGTPHSDMHECIDAAIEKVIELGYADEKSIGYEGFSYGGHSGMYMSTQNNRFAAIAAGAGVSNLIQGFNVDIVSDGSNEQDYYMTGQGRLGTDPLSNTEMFISESAVFNALNMNTPLLLFHGTEDNVVKWEHSFGFYSILRYHKKPVVFLSYRGEGHGLKKKSNRLDIQNKLKEYFDHYLKGKEAGKWITEGLPYLKEKSDKQKTNEKRTEVPVWK